jgi:hypothetical protein
MFERTDKILNQQRERVARGELTYCTAERPRRKNSAGAARPEPYGHDVPIGRFGRRQIGQRLPAGVVPRVASVR